MPKTSISKYVCKQSTWGKDQLIYRNLCTFVVGAFVFKDIYLCYDNSLKMKAVKSLTECFVN